MKRVLKPILATSIILAALTAGTFYFLTKGGGSPNAFESRITKEQSDEMRAQLQEEFDKIEI